MNYVNEKTKVLRIFKENKIEIEGKKYNLLNQQKNSKLVPYGMLKMNQIIKGLIEEKYVEMVHAKRCYLLTSKGYELLKKCPYIVIRDEGS